MKNKTLLLLSSFQVLLIGSLAQGREEQFFLGTFTGKDSASEGIYTGTLNTDTGKLSPLVLAGRSESPSFIALSPDKSTLYAAEEVSGVGRVESFRVHADGSLTELNERSSEGTSPCHISVDPSGKNVFVANYSSGNIVCFHLRENGSLGPVTAQIQFTGSGPNKDRQSSSHAHFIQSSPDGAYVYACDLGSDRVRIFDFTPATGHLELHSPATASVPPGHGVRHLAFTEDGKFVYASNEMGNSASVFSRDKSGSLDRVQTIPTLASGHPEHGVTTAEIALSPSQKFLYVSNRGCDTVTVFKVGPDGKLELKQIAKAEVNFPRGFGIDPTGRWILIGGQKDSRLAVLRVKNDGSVSASGETASVGMPVCVVWK